MINLQYLPVIEVLFFNSLTVHRCCEQKYSTARTVLVLVLFSFVLSVIGLFIPPSLRIQGDGSLSLWGFVYIIPLRYLYRERTPLLFVIMCSCWVYTLGIQALACQIAGLLAPHSVFYVLAVETLLFLITMVPFYRTVVPKYVFVLDNLKFFDQNWYRYLIVNNCLNFLCLVVLNIILLEAKYSVYNILVLILLLSSTYVSYFMLYKIVTDAIKMNQLERVALHDSLTGLGNRAQLLEHLQELIEKEGIFSVLFMDLDHFKQINDRYGHMTGDQYLKHFAGVCSDIIQDQGNVYRFGGDEFVVLYYGIVPQAVLDSLKECRGWNHGAPCPFNQVSIGVLFCQPPHTDADQILQRVDDIMYQNKVVRAAACT